MPSLGMVPGAPRWVYAPCRHPGYTVYMLSCSMYTAGPGVPWAAREALGSGREARHGRDSLAEHGPTKV